MGKETVVKRARYGFTMTELLVVIAIVATLSAVLYPVIVAAKDGAKKIACVQNFKNIQSATSLYLIDYDDRFVPVNHQPATDPNSSNDRTWVQLVMPYVGSFNSFRCPADESDRPRRETTFDQDLVPGDTYSQYYSASLRTNVGYNFIYFSPIFKQAGSWSSQPRLSTDIENLTSTLMFIDSVWSRTKEGTPIGGGSWLVVPPCRYEQAGSTIRDTFSKQNPTADTVYTYEADGWEVGQEVSRLRYGGAWPWHQGRMTVIAADGHALTMRPEQIVDGCDVMPNWSGYIKNQQRYLWDFE